ncbi:hypothetical protein [Thermococcus sp.]
MVKMERMVSLLIIIAVALSIPAYVSAQDGIKVFSVDDVIAGHGQALVFAGHQELTGCDSQQGCWKAGKLSWYLYENGSFRRVDFGDYTPLFWWDGWILARITPYHLRLIRLKNWRLHPLLNLSVHSWDMYFNGRELVIADKHGYYNSTTLYFFNGTISPVRVEGEVDGARWGEGAWIFEYSKRIRRGPGGFIEGLYVLKDGRLFRFSTPHLIRSYSFNGTHVLIEVNDYINRTPWYALYLWNLTSPKFILNTTSPYMGFSIHGWNGSWYLGDTYSIYSQNPLLYRLDGSNLTPAASGYTYVKGYGNVSPKLVVGDRILRLKGLAETRVRIEHYLGSMDYWYYMRRTASFEGGVAYVKYGKEKRLVVLERREKRVIPLGVYFGEVSIIPAGRELLIYSYWNNGGSKLYIYREGKLEELTDELESLTGEIKLEGPKIESVFPWSNGLFLRVNPLWDGRLLYHYNWTNFTLVGLNFRPLGVFGEFYVLNSPGGISYLHNGSCLWRANALNGEYAGGVLIARNGTATEGYTLNGGGLRRILRLEIPLKFLYRAGRYPVFRQEGTNITAIFNGSSFLRLPVDGRVLGLPEGGVIIWRHGELYLWDFKKLKKIGKLSENLVPIDYRKGLILGEPAASGAFKSLYIYNGSSRVLFPAENGALYHYLNGTVVKRKCRFFLFMRCNYTVFDINGSRIGRFTGKDSFGYSFWNGGLYFTNGTHLIEMGNGGSRSLKLPFEIERASMVASKEGLVIFGGDRLLLYNGTFRDLSGEFLSAYRNQPYYPSNPLRLCKKAPFRESGNNTAPTPSSTSSSTSTPESPVYSSTPLPSPTCTPTSGVSAVLGGLALAAVLLIGVLHKIRRGR